MNDLASALDTAGPYHVSKDEITEFAKKYDAQPFHTNEEAAARSVFGGLTSVGRPHVRDTYFVGEQNTAVFVSRPCWSWLGETQVADPGASR